ncbi:MAG: Sorbitol dehydrogenase [uncultured Friedmanniella sp.]|uniref:Sorbitol dehydrogenase n=1 Tax=uncultured Friedmanniella sp. TaxID=335381 RepID=A0A6J4LAT7_9ACTN|nr:NAD(P)-dependent alcohol dehydrogenase [uncultured Friedmanniella sp.]CAA9327224.1 MAG: Sorbitol dehydrogenase [uncultured Friedmanniella sp.]
MTTTSTPSDQTRALLMREREVAVEPAPVPQPGPHQVLIEVAAVGICGSDVHYYEHGRIADFVVRAPLVLGHEASGTIRALGSKVTDRSVGQRVAMEPQETCGRCVQCLAGRYNLCPQVSFFATPPVHGAFAQYVVLDSSRAHPVPDSLSDEAAALIEPLSVAVWAGRKANIQPGDRVLVTGAGPVGLLCADVARAHGAAWVGVSDTNDTRLEVARSRGASQVMNVASAPLETQVEPVDVILECSGATPAVQAAFGVAAPAARVVLVGLGAPDMELPVATIQVKELWVTGVFRYANCYPAAIALAASGAVDLDGLVTGRFGLEQVEAALTASRTDPHSLKPVVYPGTDRF